MDVGDLFGAWVPDEWINQILDVVRECPHHTFQFLTKNPNCYLQFEFPENSWVGTSINSDKDAQRAKIIQEVKAPVRFLSIEPLLGEVSFDFAGLQWIILGTQTGKNPQKPKQQWIDHIIDQTRQLKIPLLMKDNISKYSTAVIQEFQEEKNQQKRKRASKGTNKMHMASTPLSSRGTPRLHIYNTYHFRLFIRLRDFLDTI